MKLMSWLCFWVEIFDAHSALSLAESEARRHNKKEANRFLHEALNSINSAYEQGQFGPRAVAAKGRVLIKYNALNRRVNAY